MTRSGSRCAGWGVVLGTLLAVLGGCPPSDPEPNAPPPAPDPNAPPPAPEPNLPAAGGSLVEVPAPLSGDNPVYPLMAAAPPAAGETVNDPRLGTAQTRVVDTVGLRHEYARHDPFNADGTLVLLLYLPAGEWRVYRTASVPYDQDANLVRTVSLEEPRWDPANPALLWGFREFRVVTVDTVSGAETIVKDFAADAALAPLVSANPDLYRVTTRDEGEPSGDFRYWALLVQGAAEDYRARYLFTWDRQQDRVLGVRALPADEARIDWAGMSPRGTWVLVGGDWDNGAPLAGLTLANRELTDFHRLDYGIAHSDVGLDSDGREVIVMQNTQTDYIDLIPLDPSTQPIPDSGGSYANTGRVPLIRLFYDSASALGLNSSVHISCNLPGYCVVSTFTEPNRPAQNWLDRTITLVRLNPRAPRVFRLAQVYGTAGAYWEETQASITRDGSRIVWATNWGQDVGRERVWLMQLALPPGWRDALAAP
ncbi:MAG: hypothetical protein AB1716_06505 [Planctomycetota bacterium]